MGRVRFALALVGGLVGLLLILPIVVCAVPFWIVSLLTRALAKRLEPPAVTWHELIEFDPELGWRAKPHLDCYAIATRDDRYHHVTDADGWPGHISLAESTVAVFGDSFAFGFAVDASNHFANLSPVPMKSVGVPGYNLVQELLLMRRIAPRLSGKQIVWFVYCGNDLFDNLAPEMNGYCMPFVRASTKGWEIVTAHIRRDRWTCSRGRADRFHLPVLAALYSPTALHHKALSACEFLIEQGRQVCADTGARLTVVSIPSPVILRPRGLELLAQHAENGTSIDPELPDAALATVCARLGVSFLALRKHLTAADYRSINDHWSERGHRRVAQILVEIYRDDSRRERSTRKRGTP